MPSCPRLLLRKASSRKTWYGNSTICVWTWQSIKSLLWDESGNIWWLKKVQYLQNKYHCQWILLRIKKSKCIFHNLGNLLRPLELVPASHERVVPTEWQVRTVLGDCISRARVIPIQAPQYRQFALISNFLDLAHLSIRGSIIDHEMDQGPT